MPPGGDAARAAELLFGDLEHKWGAPEPELLGVLAPFLHGPLLAAACDYGGYALPTRGSERPVGTELLNAVDAVARRLAEEGGSSFTLRAVDGLMDMTSQPLARPVWDAATNLAHTAEQWSPIQTPWLTPWRGGMIEAARAATGRQEQAGLYAAAVAWEPREETLAEAAAFADGLPPHPRAVLLAWCVREAPEYRDSTLTAVAEALEGELHSVQLETLAAVGLTAPELAGALADETAARAGDADWRDTGLVAEWLEVALREPPPERVQWRARKEELATQFEVLDELTREILINEYLDRLVGRWGGAPPAAAAAPAPAPPSPEASIEAPSPPRGGRSWIEVFKERILGHQAGADRPPYEVLPNQPDEDDLPYMVRDQEDRYLNLAIADTERRELRQTQTLLPNTGYLVQLDVGPQSETSIVVDPEEFDVSLLEPDTPEGYWLDVVVASADVDVERGVHRLFLPFAGRSWVCECGIQHSCAPGDRRPHVHIRFDTRDTGAATLRCTVYHGNHVVQSARIELVVADGAQRPDAQRADVDYTLSAHFTDVDALPERDVSVLTNETPGGTHSVVIKVDGRDIPVNISEAVAGSTIKNIRTQLSLITVGSDGKSPQFGDDNQKSRDELIKDLEQLATLGARLWERVTPDGADYDYVRDKLRKRSTIQVARVQGAVFPWALVYDIGSEAFAGWKPCRLLREWDTQRHKLRTYPEECPFADEHRRNILCPYGFWGYRHLLEQPPSRALITEIPLRQGARAAVVRNLALDASHVDRIRGCLTRFAVSDCDSVADLIAAIRDPLLPLVYFYCHGDTALLADTDERLPYLEIGAGDKIAPGDFRVWADDGEWNVANWTDVPPLVFINGCSTTAITPEGVVNFVDKLVQVGAAGVVGTEITVAERTAAEIAIRFYGYFASAEAGSVGDALYRTRIDMLGKGNVSGLVYTPFCSMNLELVEQAA